MKCSLSRPCGKSSFWPSSALAHLPCNAPMLSPSTHICHCIGNCKLPFHLFAYVCVISQRFSTVLLFLNFNFYEIFFSTLAVMIK